jgi:hypothetical protein
MASFPKDGFHIQPRDIVFRHINMIGVLVGRNHHLRAMLDFAAKHDIRAKIKTYRLEDLNGLVGDYHKGAGGKLVVDLKRKQKLAQGEGLTTIFKVVDLKEQPRFCMVSLSSILLGQISSSGIFQDLATPLRCGPGSDRIQFGCPRSQQNFESESWS